MHSLEQRRLSNLQEAQGEVPPIEKICTILTNQNQRIKIMLLLSFDVCNEEENQAKTRKKGLRE